MDTLKAETTKAAVRQAWDIARDYFSSGGASAFP